MEHIPNIPSRIKKNKRKKCNILDEGGHHIVLQKVKVELYDSFNSTQMRQTKKYFLFHFCTMCANLVTVGPTRRKEKFYMLNFIMYEKNQNNREEVKKVIRKFLYNFKDCYKIYEFDKYNMETKKKIETIQGTKIFLINIDYENAEGLKLAKTVRQSGNIISPIILFTSKNKNEALEDTQRVLFLDIIKLDEQFISKLMENLIEAYRIVTTNAVYTFSIFDEIYRIPYDEIYYIEKNNKDNSVTIHTKDDTYLHYASIKNLEKHLSHDARFYKSHRSCIINIYNIASYDKKDNIVIFNNGTKIDYVAKSRKTELAKMLTESEDSVDQK